jgi:DNA polymerase-3 subunit delta'
MPDGTDGDAALYGEVVGQERAVAQLRAAAEHPVHAYLLSGPPGTGKRAAARSLAASLLCPQGGCGNCPDCRLALAERHPDLVVVERVGPFITVEQAREITRLAARSPVQSARKVLLLVDFHLVQQSGPALLKTIEEPPADTHFIILADHVPPELVTIASRCVRIDFGPLALDRIVAALEAEGVEAGLARELAESAGGRLDRARLLAADPGFAARRRSWRDVPGRLDGTGRTVAAIATELVGLLDESAEWLRVRHTEEADELDQRLRATGERGSSRRDLEDRQKRELRRARTDELRAGLVALASVYRDKLVMGEGGVRALRTCVDATEAIARLNEELVRNPNETLQLQALLLTLSRAGA